MRLPCSMVAAPLLLLAACDSVEEAPAASANEAAATSAPPPAPAKAAAVETSVWAAETAANGSALRLSSGGRQVIRLACSVERKTLSVEVPAFRRIGSEDRLSFGSGGEVVALVASQPAREGAAGVDAAGALPGNLAALIAGPISASYGAQASGPHPAPPRDMARAFVAACKPAAATAAAPAAPAGACAMQGSERLEIAPLRALGTEPFWSARIDGRCVTYSHPDDQPGTRVWTRYTPGANGGTWAGELGGKPFELRTRAAPGCTDGMSDRSYPIAVDLLVGGEQRQGCATPP